MISGPPTPPSGTPGPSNATPGQPPLPPPGPPSGPPIPPGRPPVLPPPSGPGPGMPGPGAPQGKRKRDPLPFIIIGIVLAVLAAVCCLGGALVLFERRTTPTPSHTPVPPPPPNSGVPLPSPGASGSEGGGNPLSGAACLVGRWREASHTSTVTIDGVEIQVRSSGGIQPEFFACEGDRLTQNTNDYAIELGRVTG